MSNFVSYQNQRSITINRDMPNREKKDRGKFLSLYYSKLSAAAQVLSEVPFKLYIYLACNEDKYDLWFSPAAFAKEFGVNVGTARRAFNTLIEEGYIVIYDKNQYSFYEEPQKQLELVDTAKPEYRWVITANGKTKMLFDDFYHLAKKLDWTDKKIEENWTKYEIAEDEVNGTN